MTFGRARNSAQFASPSKCLSTQLHPHLSCYLRPQWRLLGFCALIFFKINSLYMFCCCCCCSIVSNSLWSHGLQHTRLPGPSPSPGACSNSCPLSQRCHPTILSSVIPFSCPQSFPASGSFPISWLFATSDQSYWSLSFSISPSYQKSYFILFDRDVFNNKVMAILYGCYIVC